MKEEDRKFKYQLLVYTADGKVHEHFVADKKSDAEALQLSLVTKPTILDGVAYSPHGIAKVTIKEFEI